MKITQLQPNAVRGELQMTVEGERRQSQTGPAAFFLSNNFWKMISLFIKKKRKVEKKKKKKEIPVPWGSTGVKIRGWGERIPLVYKTATNK